MEEAVIKRILPHSTEAEEAVIASMLMNKDAILETTEILTGEDFYQTAYGILFDAMAELFHMGRPVDLITLQEYLKEKIVPPDISSLYFVMDIVAGFLTWEIENFFAHIIK